MSGNTPGTNGPYANGAKSLAKESKVGIPLAAFLAWALTNLATQVGNWDASEFGWWASAVVQGVAMAAGLAAAYLKKNR